MTRAGRLVLAAVLLAPVAASAQQRPTGSVEIGAGFYRPKIDSQSGLGTPLPYEQIFGTRRGWMFRLGYSYAFFTQVGTLEAGFRTGYFRASGHALTYDASGNLTANQSANTTSFNVIPTSLTATYRFDWLAERYPIPLAPYGRLALERYNWWVSNAHGGTAKVGATNGWSATAGVALLLDFLDRQAARELRGETGIQHTYAFADFTWSKVNDFGSKRSWDLSDPRPSLSFGLMFVF